MHYLLFIFIFPKLPSFFFILSCLPLLCRSTPLSPFPSSFDFRVGVLHGFSRKSNKGEFSRKTKWGPEKKQFFFVFLGVLYGFSRKSNGKRMGAEKKAIFLFSLGFCMDFLGNQTENEWRRKKSNFFCFP